LAHELTTLLQVPERRLFKLRTAARYLDLHPNTLRKYADLGRIKARKSVDEAGRAQRVFTLDALNEFIDSLPEWYDDAGGKSGTGRSDDGY
jgi:hypothetical protein